MYIIYSVSLIVFAVVVSHLGAHLFSLRLPCVYACTSNPQVEHQAQLRLRLLIVVVALPADKTTYIIVG